MIISSQYLLATALLEVCQYMKDGSEGGVIYAR